MVAIEKLAEVPRLCQLFLRAAANAVRSRGLARGTRINDRGQVCMLGAMDVCGVSITIAQRRDIEHHVASLLPARPDGMEGDDKYNVKRWSSDSHTIAWWSNMIAKDAEEVVMKLEAAADSC